MMPNTQFMAVKQGKAIIYGIKMMPNSRYALNVEKAVFDIEQRRIVLRLRYPMTAFNYILRGVS